MRPTTEQPRLPNFDKQLNLPPTDIEFLKKLSPVQARVVLEKLGAPGKSAREIYGELLKAEVSENHAKP